MSVFLFIIIIVGLVTFGEVASKWLEGGAKTPALEPGRDRDEELAGLREQVSLLADQVERLSEEQRFITRLLEGSPASKLPSGESRQGSDPGRRAQEPN